MDECSKLYARTNVIYVQMYICTCTMYNDVQYLNNLSEGKILLYIYLSNMTM